ncbi:MAG: cytochrome c biogenesis protein CcdA [bacterium]|nr:cytochrome c biogenesis protein CcdA [bacterium]
MIRNFALSAFALALLTLPVFGQDDMPPVPVQALWKSTGLPIAGSAELGVVFDVPKGHHITDVDYGLFFVEIADTFGIHFDPPRFPPGIPYHDERAYRGRTIVMVSATASDSAVPGEYSWPVNVGFQICQEFGTEMCYLPHEETVTVTVNVVPAGTAVEPANLATFEVPVEVEKKLSLEERLMAALEQGSWLAFLLVFVGGILTSFTPCVYPVIPITIGYIGGASKGKPLRGLGLSAIFALGIAIVYSSLGLFAAATGSLFGSVSGSPLVNVVVAVVFALMGFSMLGAFDIALPSALQTSLSGGTSRRGFFGPLLLGMASGLIMAPCVGPVIVALLAWVAKSGNLLYGWALLFTFSFGLAMLFLVIGTFAGAIQALPRAGAWMETIKKTFGWILLAGAFYMLRLTIPEPYYTLAWGVLLIVFAVFAHAFDAVPEDAGGGRRLWKAVALIAFLGGAIALFRVFGPGVATVEAPRADLEWIVNDEERALELAAGEGKPMIMDFYADWCVACVELDEKTWSKPDVVERLGDFVRLKFDFTRETPWAKEMKQKYEITGMPTVILFDRSGEEAARFAGFLPPSDVIALLNQHNL